MLFCFLISMKCSCREFDKTYLKALDFVVAGRTLPMRNQQSHHFKSFVICDFSIIKINY